MKQFLLQSLAECLYEIKNIPVRVLERNLKKELGRKARKIINGG